MKDNYPPISPTPMHPLEILFTLISGVEKVVKTLNDLVLENSSIKCFNEIKGVLGTKNSLDYFQVISKIPATVKKSYCF